MKPEWMGIGAGLMIIGAILVSILSNICVSTFNGILFMGIPLFWIGLAIFLIGILKSSGSSKAISKQEKVK